MHQHQALAGAPQLGDIGAQRVVVDPDAAADFDNNHKLIVLFSSQK